MNYDRFVAANGMALITHTLVSTISIVDMIVDLKKLDPTNGYGQNQSPNAPRRKGL